MAKIKSAYYSISIGGKKLDNEKLSLVQEIVYEDSSTGSDLLTITIKDPDFIFIADNVFLEEKTVSFKGGWEGDLGASFDGYISVIDIDFPQDGSPVLTLHCMDNSHIMNRKKNKKTWKNKKVSDVATEVFKKHGLKTVVDDTGKVEEDITQSDSTDIQFLIDLANREIKPYLVYVEGKTGYFIKKPKLGKEQATISYRTGGMEIINFTPRINKQVKQIDVEKSDINDKTKAVDTAKVTDATPRDLQGDAVKTKEGKATEGSSNIKHKYINGKWVEVR